jgi:hypothetical protein
MQNIPKTFNDCIVVIAGRRPLKKELRLGGRSWGWAVFAMVMIFFMAVLSGCGSDSTSAPGAKTMAKTTPRHDNKIKREPKTQQASDLFFEAKPGMNMEDLAKKMAAIPKIKDPNIEVLPGLTLGKLQAQQAVVTKKLQNPNTEVFPGVNLKEIQNRQALAAKTVTQMMQDPQVEIFPGLTVAELHSRQAAAAKKTSSTQPEIFPGVNPGELNAKQGQAAQKLQDLRLMDVFPSEKK